MRYTFLHYPFLSEASVWLAVATDCAGRQGKFLEYHDAVFRSLQDKSLPEISKDSMGALAGRLGLDRNAFDACFANGETFDEVRADRDQAAAMGVKSTPSILINGVLYIGAQSFEFYKSKIEVALAAK